MRGHFPFFFSEKRQNFRRQKWMLRSLPRCSRKLFSSPSFNKKTCGGIFTLPGASILVNHSHPHQAASGCISLGLPVRTRSPLHTRAMSSSATASIKYLGQEEAANIDNELMGEEHGFVVEQLMELAGLSVATATAKAFPNHHRSVLFNVLVAMALLQLGIWRILASNPPSFIPNQSTSLSFKYFSDLGGLVKQCKALSIPVLQELRSSDYEKDFDVIMDAIFGFSFKGTSIRAPFDSIIETLKNTKVPIISIDIPSGWDVEEGNINGIGIPPPAMLVSLTAPKLCAKHFHGEHWLGGRFIPKSMAAKYQLNLPPYPGTECVLRLSEGASPSAL
ncbi:NAD(P)H-hydrate epimerase [Balamuthia mandrillaris]